MEVYPLCSLCSCIPPGSVSWRRSASWVCCLTSGSYSAGALLVPKAPRSSAPTSWIAKMKLFFTYTLPTFRWTTITRWPQAISNFLTLYKLKDFARGKFHLTRLRHLASMRRLKLPHSSLRHKLTNCKVFFHLQHPHNPPPPPSPSVFEYFPTVPPLLVVTV